VGDQVHLGKARGRHVPVVGLEGDVMLEQRPWLRAAVEAALEPPRAPPEAAIDRAGADGAELLLHLRRDREVPLRPRQPYRQQRGQARRPRIAGHLPQRAEDGHGLGEVGRGAPAAAWRGARGWWAGLGRYVR
jgi:hypothetical protein